MSSFADTWAVPSPEQIIEYVRRSGWRHIGSNQVTALYQQPDGAGSSRQLLIPLSTGLTDYVAAMRTAVVRLAEAEGRDPELTALVLSADGADLVEVMAESAEPGVISLDDAAALFSGSRKLVLAAAASALSRAAAFGSSRPEQAERYLAAVRARVVPGSFVVSLSCPLSPAAAPGDRLRGSPYGRRVTSTLVDAVAVAVSIVSSAEPAGSDDAWRETVKVGVSADLVDGLASIAPGDDQAARHVTVDFARSVPTQGDRERSIEIPPGLARPLKDASARLRRLAGVTPAGIVGIVTSLERERTGGRTMTAKILGNLTVPHARPRRVTIRISAADMDENLLIESYRTRRPIEAHGELILRSRLSEMTSVSFIRLLSGDDPDVENPHPGFPTDA